jgi:uncharacterized repeat protein (TIGR02543 family)
MSSNRQNRPTVALRLTAFTAIAVIFLSLSAAGTNAAGFSFIDSIRDILGIPAAETSVLKASPVETNLAKDDPKTSFDTSLVFTGTSLLTDDFNYSGALSSNGWSVHSVGSNPLSTTTGLTYSGYPGSGIGNAVLVSNLGGEDINRGLSADQTGNGTNVYVSFLANVNDAATSKTGDYFFHLGDRTTATTFTNFAGRVYGRIVSSNVNFGINNASANAFGTTNFSKNTTYLLVIKYTINTGGNDSASLWVLPSGVPTTEAAAGTPESTTVSLGQDTIDALGLRQGSATTSIGVVVDGIRVGTTWESAVSTSRTVTFNSNGGSAVASQSVIDNTTATQPADPTKSGFTFGGWYSDAGLTTSFSFATAITADTTLFAKWNAAVTNYTLTYTAGANGSIIGTSPQTVASGGNGTAVTAVPNAGYHFVNWSDVSTSNPRTDTNVTGNITVTANFAINTYTLTYTAGANGSLTGTSPQTVNHGANGTAVTAIPDANYHFVNWSDASTSNPRTDTNVTANITVTANFAINTYTLTYTAGANGSLTGTSPQTVNHGANGTAVTAVPDANYHFVNWSDASTANPRTDSNVTANISVTANFAINTYSLAYTAGANGTLTGTTSQTVNHGASGSAVSAVPNTGYHFVDWSDASTSNPRTDTNVTANITVTANFAINTYSLTYTAGANGSLSGVSPQTVNHGANGTAVTAVPDANYHFVNWSDASTSNPRTDTNVTANITVTANFAINTYSLTYTAGANGSLTGTTPQTVNHGANGTAVTAVPDTGYHFVNWSDSSTQNPRTDTNVTTNITVTANFAINTYTLTYTAGANGSLSGVSPQTVNHGTSGSAVTAVPDANYHFVNWSDASTANPRTDSNVAGNISVTANFAINTYTLTYTAGANGSLTGTTSQTVNHGANGTAVTAVPNAGYSFVNWSDASTSNPRTDSNVTANISVTANFAPNDVSTNTSGTLAAGSYNNITVDGPAVITLAGDSEVQGCVTINNGATVVMGTFIFSGPGCFTLNPGGSLSSGSAAGITTSGATGSVQVAGARTYSGIASYTYNGSTNQAVGDGLPGSVTNLTINNSGADGSNTVTGNGGQAVTGLLRVIDGVYESHSDYADVTIEAAGTLTLTGATTVSGNWTNNGGTLTGNFPVTLDGATGQTISGNTTFYGLTKSVTSAQTLNFAAASTTTVTNSLTLNGTAGNLLSLRSTAPASQWNLIATGSHTVGYADVQDSNATGSSGAINASNSFDSGNNANWTFNTVTNYTITVTQTANGTISPGTTTVTSGSNATFHIVPNTGYDIATLVVDGVSIPVQSPYTFTNVTANHTLTATYTVAACRTISIPTLTSTTGIPVVIPVNTTSVTGGNVISAQFKVTYDPAVITPIAGTDAGVVTAGPVLPSGTMIDINRSTPGIIEFSINGSTPFSGSGALVNLHMNVIGAPLSSTPLALTAINDITFPTIFYNGGTVCASATSGSLSVIANATTTTVTSSPSGTSVYGDNVTFTATVSPAVTGGTVQFLIDGNLVGAPVAVVSGVATFATTALTVSGSPHTITGDFSGFTPYAGSSGSTTISITPRPITVTAVSDSKVYDGTTDSSATPAITGTLANSDTAAFIQTFDNKDVGTGKTLMPSGTVNDGNGGANYSITFVAVNTGTITAKPIAVTAVSDSKNYDGTTSSGGTPLISPSLALGDTGNFVQVFDNRNAGTGKTLIPSGSVIDGNGGGNYNVTFANNTNGTIIARAITVTAVAETREYDGTTNSSATPTISPALISGDTSGFIQTFDNKNVDTGKTITASGSVTDGNVGANYTVTFVSNTNGEITARAITVTAVTDTKVYDGTTASTGTPTVTFGSLASGDTASFTQTFDTKNVGTGKTITSAGTITDGNGGGNYVVTYTPVTTGVITAKPITVTAVSETKVYDGTTASGDTPNISPSLAVGDSSGFIQTFDNKNVGTGKTLTASGSVNDGNSGANYAVTFVANNTGVITARAITVTAATDSKAYDGTTASAGIPTITLGSLAVGDTASFTQTFDNKNVGTGKTLTASGVVTDDNSGNNYTVTFVANTTGVITTRAITVTAAADTKVYDGTTASAGIPTITFGSLAIGDTATFTQTFDTRHAGIGKTLTPAGIVTDGNSGNNYAVTYSVNTNGVITAKSATWTTNPASKTFGDADPVPLTTGSGSGFLLIDGVSATYSRAAGEAASPPTYHITALLSAATGDLNDYAITNNGAEFTINARTLTGQVTYENTALVVPVPHTTITAAGPAPLPLAVQNDLLSGNYSISGFGAGSYTITPSKAPYAVNINNGIFANDASLISQHVVHLITLNPTQQRAAQVGGLGTVTAFDAALVAQYIVGIPNPLNTSGNWVFTPASPSLTVTPTSVQNFAGLLMGDVSGDWAPETARPSAANKSTSVRALLTDMTAAPGSNVAIPLKIENLGGAGVTAYQFDVEYDPSVISPAAVAASVNGTVGQGLSVVSNAPTPGLLKVVVYGALPVSGEGVYVNLQFSTIGGVGATTPLNISQFRLNDGTSPVYTINGSVTIGRADDNSLHGRVMTPTGAGLANARVIATTSTGERFTVLAGSMGYFEFGGLAVNETYTISVESKRYTFTPRTVSLTSSISIDMIADQ